MSEQPTTDRTPETPAPESAAEAGAPESPALQGERAKAVSFSERLRQTREAGKKSWGEALERARTYFEPEIAAAAPVAEQAREALEATHPVAAGWGEQVQAWAQGVLKREPFALAQERGARLLLNAVRRLRGGIEALEQNLEAASPEAEAPAAA